MQFSKMVENNLNDTYRSYQGIWYFQHMNEKTVRFYEYSNRNISWLVSYTYIILDFTLR